MNNLNKKIVISTTPLNHSINNKKIDTTLTDTSLHLEIKKNSENSNKIFNSLLNSFELGADPKRFIVSSEILNGESTLLRTKNAFLENISQLDWITDFQSEHDPFPIDKCGDALRIGSDRIGITILYNPQIQYKNSLRSYTIESINDAMKITNQKLTVYLKIINQESPKNNDLLLLESIRQLQDEHLNPDSWIFELNGNENIASLISSQAQIDERLNTSVILKINNLEEIQKKIEIIASTIGIQGLLLDFAIWENFLRKLESNFDSKNSEHIIGNKILEIIKRLDYINTSMNLY